MQINLARIMLRSSVNGPGERFVIWVQGCPLACPGCWNPDTWSFEKRWLRNTRDIIEQIRAAEDLEGVTFTGGEPFMQAAALADIGEAVQQMGRSVFVFSGYTLDELSTEKARRLLSVTDVLVSGRYDQTMPTSAHPFCSSSNQQVHFLTNRYGPENLLERAEAELHIAANGQIVLTGFPSKDWLSHS